MLNILRLFILRSYVRMTMIGYDSKQREFTRDISSNNKSKTSKNNEDLISEIKGWRT